MDKKYCMNVEIKEAGVSVLLRFHPQANHRYMFSRLMASGTRSVPTRMSHSLPKKFKLDGVNITIENHDEYVSVSFDGKEIRVCPFFAKGEFYE